MLAHRAGKEDVFQSLIRQGVDVSALKPYERFVDVNRFQSLIRQGVDVSPFPLRRGTGTLFRFQSLIRQGVDVSGKCWHG